MIFGWSAAALAAVPCVEPVLFEPLAPLETSRLAPADLDGDGDLDLALITTGNRWVAWLENEGGALGPPRVIDAAAVGAEALVVADVDGDGTPDLLAGFHDRLVWYRRDAGAWAPAEVLDPDAPGAGGLAVVDLDDDGSPDVVYGARDASELRWVRSLPGAAFAPPTVLASDARGVSDLVAVDLDGDGDPDLVAADRLGDGLDLYENLGGGAVGARRRVVPLSSARRVRAADLDGDGDLDLVGAGFGPAVWAENLGGAFAAPIALDTEDTQDLAIADLDGDGRPEVLLAGRRHLAWTDPAGPPRIVEDGWEARDAAATADLDGDGRPELLYATADALRSLSSTGPEAWAVAESITPAPARQGASATGDLDGDGDLDLVVGSSRGLVWFRHEPAAWVRVPIAEPLDEPFDLAIADLDLDGWNDVVVARHLDGVSWARGGPDGPGPLGPLIPDQTLRLLARDLDGDGAADLLAAAEAAPPRWHRNVGGTLGPGVPLATPAAWDLATGDVDRDGRPDVLVAGGPSGGLVWSPNGPGGFGPGLGIGPIPDRPLGVDAADADSDGNPDLAVAGAGGGGVAAVVWVHGDGGGFDLTTGFWGATGDQDARDAAWADLDADGRPELLAILAIPSLSGGTNVDLVAWDTSGVPTPPGPPQTLQEGLDALRVEVADLDGDGSVDPIVAFTDGMRWYPSCGAWPPETPPGDTGSADTAGPASDTGPALARPDRPDHLGPAPGVGRCGCETPGGGSAWAAVLLVSALVRRSRWTVRSPKTRRPASESIGSGPRVGCGDRI